MKHTIDTFKKVAVITLAIATVGGTAYAAAPSITPRGDDLIRGDERGTDRPTEKLDVETEVDDEAATDDEAAVEGEKQNRVRDIVADAWAEHRSLRETYPDDPHARRDARKALRERTRAQMAAALTPEQKLQAHARRDARKAQRGHGKETRGETKARRGQGKETRGHANEKRGNRGKAGGRAT